MALTSLTRTRSPTLALILALIPSACLSIGTGHPEPPSVSGRPLTTWVVVMEGRRELQLHVRNDTDSIYRLTAIRLRSCRNVRESCGEHGIDVVLCPGETRTAFSLRPVTLESQDRIYFDWDYDARSYEPGEPVVGARCGEAS